jgi:transposase
MSKSDLEARPIFLRLEDSIRSHVLICFVALMMGKYLELETGLSVRRIRDALWEIRDVTLKDTSANELFVIKSSLERMAESELGRLARAWKLIE